MRHAIPLVALLVAGCVSDVALEIDIRPLSAVPPEVTSWELRLLRLEGLEVCPSVTDAARAAPVGRLAHAQSFADEGIAIGEVPAGRWGFAVVARDDACTVHLYGCAEVVIGSGIESPIVIEPVAATSSESCGCRTCGAGVCSGVEVCE